MMQPAARAAGRLRRGLTPLRLRGVHGFAAPFSRRVEQWHKHWIDPASRLASLEAALRRGGAAVLRGHEFSRWDLELRGGLVGRVRIRQFTSDLAFGAQYVRLDASPRAAGGGVLLFVLLVLLCTGAAVEGAYFLALAFWVFAAALAVLTLREMGAAMATFTQTARAPAQEPDHGS